MHVHAPGTRQHLLSSWQLFAFSYGSKTMVSLVSSRRTYCGRILSHMTPPFPLFSIFSSYFSFFSILSVDIILLFTHKKYSPMELWIGKRVKPGYIWEIFLGQWCRSWYSVGMMFSGIKTTKVLWAKKPYVVIKLWKFKEMKLYWISGRPNHWVQWFLKFW